MTEDFSGEIVNETLSGKVILKYENGKKNGWTKFVSPENVVQTEIPYIRDEIHGQLKQYYENGKLMAIITYEKNEQTGPMMTFFENGVKQLDTFYTKGKINGKYKTYDEFGDLLNEVTYVNGAKHGQNVVYYPKSHGGGICELSFYENGVLQGDKVTFYNSGEIMTTTPYINGKAQAYPKNFTKIGEEII
jgi:antitoxin component YwqK of YwqJK toxin-antitoxin module